MRSISLKRIRELLLKDKPEPKIWFEVFISHYDGAITVEKRCRTLRQAEAWVVQVIIDQGYEPQHIHIDKWTEGQEFPEPVI